MVICHRPIFRVMVGLMWCLVSPSFLSSMVSCYRPIFSLWSVWRASALMIYRTDQIVFSLVTTITLTSPLLKLTNNLFSIVFQAIESSSVIYSLSLKLKFYISNDWSVLGLEAPDLDLPSNFSFNCNPVTAGWRKVSELVFQHWGAGFFLFFPPVTIKFPRGTKLLC